MKYLRVVVIVLLSSQEKKITEVSVSSLISKNGNTTTFLIDVGNFLKRDLK
jgi:hypothetical protein